MKKYWFFLLWVGCLLLSACSKSDGPVYRPPVSSLPQSYFISLNIDPDRLLCLPLLDTGWLTAGAVYGGVPNPLYWSWKQVSGPGRVLMADSTGRECRIRVADAGVYEFEVTATDKILTSATGRQKVEVWQLPANPREFMVQGKAWEAAYWDNEAYGSYINIEKLDMLAPELALKRDRFLLYMQPLGSSNWILIEQYRNLVRFGTMPQGTIYSDVIANGSLYLGGPVANIGQQVNLKFVY